MSHAIATDEDPTPESLWEVLLYYYIQCIVPMFGSARTIAEKHSLNREEHFHLQGWLFRCEELFRRLLFIAALKLIPAIAEPQQSEATASRTIARDPTPFDPEHPETWRVSFSIASSTPHAGWTAGLRPACAPGGARSNLPPLGPQPSEFVVPRDPPKVITLADLMRGATQAPKLRHADPGLDPGEARRTAQAEPRLVYDAYPIARRIEALERATQNKEHHIQRMACWLVRNARQALRFTLPTLSRQRLKTRPGDIAVEDAARLATRAYAALVALCDSS